jgi:hypothetical protein
VGGTGSSGTLTIPAAGNVVATAPAYGDSAAPTTPTLPAQGTWNVTTSFPGAGYYAGISNAPAASTYTGTILGTAGTASLESHSNCVSDGATGCVTTASYKSADMANAIPTNIKNSVMIAGVTGALDSPNAWDLRVGVTAGGVTGKLKVNCRNRVRSAVYNYDGSLASIPASGVTSGTVIDYWDTIDDLNNYVSGLPTSVVPGWTNNDCGGVEASAGDDNVWKDITTTTLGAASTCGTTADMARCTRQDKISGLSWSKIQGTSRTWPQAIKDCDELDHNGQTDWRLPTQKELMDAYNHGIRSAAHDNWITEAAMANDYFWSASSLSDGTDNAWYVNLAYGVTNGYDKGNPNQVVCVR